MSSSSFPTSIIPTHSSTSELSSISPSDYRIGSIKSEIVNYEETCCCSSIPTIPEDVNIFNNIDNNVYNIPKNVFFIINPYSGNKNSINIYNIIKPMFEKSNILCTSIETNEKNHAFNISKNTKFDNYDAIVIIGGDGTLNEVINGLMIQYNNSDKIIPPIGIIPGGTGNSISVSLSLDDYIQAANAIIAGCIKKVDVGKVTFSDNNIKYMINVLGWGLGVDANVTAESLRCCGPLRYDLGAIWQILLGTERRAKVNIDGEILDDDFSIIVVLNNQHGGSRLRLAPYAKMDDGCLDVLLAKNQSRSENIHMFDELKRGGSHVYLDYVVYKRFKKMMLESHPSETLINIDGENEGKTPFTIEVVKHAISMYYKK